ncbi:NAD(P)H-dependent oxidoreductase [Providencia sp.]|uniref:NAD(P)H-dependent oxidoreductase n=1 Tax=Providencia sp. TaxID=589 RepID=UPI00300FE112
MVRSVINNLLPTLDSKILAAFTSSGTLTKQQQAQLDLSNQLIEEIKQNNIIVIVAPIYNFTISFHLKHYFDFIAGSGHTFKYTEQGAIGLKSKHVYIFTSRDGIYKDIFANQAYIQAQKYINCLVP